MRPYVQIGFMPEALSTHPKPYQHNWVPGGRNPLSTGWAYPPKDYQKWAELVFQWVKHSVERYGRAEVEGWYWEVWNEPNIFYWRGTPAEYHKLYDYAVDAVKRARRRLAWAGRMSRDLDRRAVRDSCVSFWTTACEERITPRGSKAHRLISWRFTPGARGVRQWPRSHGNRRSASGHRSRL